LSTFPRDQPSSKEKGGKKKKEGKRRWIHDLKGKREREKRWSPPQWERREGKESAWPVT